jgi:hypothetical protein
MKFVTVRDLRGRPTKVWKDLKSEKELVLTSNGRLLALRRARLGETVREIQRASRERNPRGMSLLDINAVIADVRKSRRR